MSVLVGGGGYGWAAGCRGVGYEVYVGRTDLIFFGLRKTCGVKSYGW